MGLISDEAIWFIYSICRSSSPASHARLFISQSHPNFAFHFPTQKVYVSPRLWSSVSTVQVLSPSLNQVQQYLYQQQCFNFVGLMHVFLKVIEMFALDNLKIQKLFYTDCIPSNHSESVGFTVLPWVPVLPRCSPIFKSI